MVIWFNSEKARKFLLENGYVITVRKRRSVFGKNEVVYWDDEKKEKIKVGYCFVEYVNESYNYRKYHRSKLGFYVKDSGFETVSEWIEEICRLNKNRFLPEYIMFLRCDMI